MTPTTATQTQIETLKGRVAICQVILRKEADRERREVAEVKLGEYLMALSEAIAGQSS